MINKCDPPPGQDNDSNATRPRAEKTVDDSWSTDWSSLIKFSYLFYSGQVKILVNDLGTLMILDTKTNSLSAYKLLQLLRRLTGWAMMAADDTYTGVEVVAELSGATTPTNGFQARARHERPPVKVGGAASSAAVSQLLSIGRRPIDDGNLKLGFLMEPWWQKAPNSNGKSS